MNLKNESNPYSIIDMSKEEYEKLNNFNEQAQAQTGIQPNYSGGTGYSQYYPYGTCPHCGYCRHCGRSGFYSQYPYYEPYKVTWWGTDSTGSTTAQSNPNYSK